MREHPIPQDITGYRFHIIGSMTLKQFAEIAIGVVIAAIFYSTNLPAIIKWPLIGISFGIGVAAAFLPIQERPLDHWIITFWKVLYKPTLFYWKRKPNIPSAFTYSANHPIVAYEPEIDLSPVRRQRIKEYIGSVSHNQAEPFALSADEQNRVSAILSTFTTQPVVVATSQTTQSETPEKPDLEVRVRKLRPQTSEETIVYVGPAVTNEPSTEPPIEPPAQTTMVETVDEPTTSTHTTPEPPNLVSVPQNQQHENTHTSQSVAYNTDLPFPSTPTETNRVVGMVLTPNNDLISDAIVEIQTTDGIVARAVKSNALGQFFITTPLANGEYTIVVEKDGFNFTPQQLLLQNQIVQPIEIRSA